MAVDKEQLQRLKDILRVPTFFRQEHQLLRHVLKYVRSLPYTVHYDIDEFGNMYLTKGEAEYYPCVCAHTDSVHKHKDYAIEEVTYKGKLRLIGKDAEGFQCGIGADDKAGVFVCLELLNELPAIKVALFAGEEFGCVGSYNAREEFFSNVGYIMEFDCPGGADVTQHCNGVQLFDEKGEFYQQIHPIMVEHMKREPLRHYHPYTDVWPLKRRFDINCINIATGYYGYHTQHEYVIVDEVMAAVTMGKQMIEQLGLQKWEYKSPIVETHSYEETKKYIAQRFPDILSSENTYTQLLTE